MSDHIAHWDEVASRTIERGDMRGERWRLGAAAGTRRVGLSRYRIPAGHRCMPVHVHADEEEIFFVLSGSGFSWQDERAWRVGAGDCLVHRVNAEAHTLVADEELDVLAFAEGSETGLTWLPRAGAWWAGPRWLPHDGPNPFEAEAAAGPLDMPAPEPGRAANVAAVADVDGVETVRGPTSVVRRDLGHAAGSERSGLMHIAIAPGARSYPHHCHSAEEEVFVILEGAGTLRLGDEELPVRAGHVIARPPGTGIAHSFRAGDGPLVMLAYGTRDPNDICFYPDSGKVSLRGVGVMTRVERVAYWDGEE